MKISELTDKQCALIAENKPTWMTLNRPEYMAKHYPEYMAKNYPEYIPLNLREVPEEIVELLK